MVNLKSNRRTRDILNSSVVKGVYRLLVLAIPERLERRLDKICHLSLALIQKVRNGFVCAWALTFHPSEVKTKTMTYWG